MKRLIIAASIAVCMLPAMASATLVVISPDGNDTWRAMTTETIEWTYSGETPDSFQIVWLEVGTENRYIIDYVDGNAREYDWLVGNPCIHAILEPIQAVVFVNAVDIEVDQSDTFTIIPYRW